MSPLGIALRRTGLFLTAIAAIGGFIACSADADTLALLNIQIVAAVPPIKAVRLSVVDRPNVPVRTSIGGDPRPSTDHLFFGYYMPGIDGTVNVLAEAIDAESCLVGMGSAAVHDLKNGKTSSSTTDLRIDVVSPRHCGSDAGMESGLTDGGGGTDYIRDGKDSSADGDVADRGVAVSDSNSVSDSDGGAGGDRFPPMDSAPTDSAGDGFAFDVAPVDSGSDTNPPARCGDKVIDVPVEVCDDGNNIDGDGCSADCKSTGACGNNIRDPGEECDNGAANSDTSPNACRTNCKNPMCGDGVTDAGEQCDDGNTISTDNCTSTCKAARCGDSFKQAGEECDNGGLNSDTAADACRTNCKSPKCGDGVTDAAEQCDDGNTINTDSCTNACKSAPCGDGFREGTEECDSGGLNSDTNPDTCRTNCKNPRCGDGVTDAGEQCDDGNTSNTDSCTNDCTIATCGDGFRQGTEQCDDGNNVNTDSCTNSCVLN